jgi:hypothetical protein
MNSHFKIYETIIKNEQNTTSTNIWLVVLSVYLLGVAFAVVLLSITLLPETNVGIMDYFGNVLGIVAVYLGGAYLITLLYAAWKGSQEPTEAEVRARVLDLLFVLSKPHAADSKGLNLDDLQQLKNLAEVEQNSADWRSAIYASVIIPFILLVVSWRDNIESMVIEPIAIEDLQGNHLNGNNILFIILILSLALAISYFFIVFCIRFQKYMVREAIVRLLLLSIEEAKWLLNAHRLGSMNLASFEQQKTIIDKLGFLVTKDGSEKSLFSLRDTDGQTYFVEVTSARKQATFKA